MDYRCPACGNDPGKERLSGSIVTRMSSECPNCKSVRLLNVHRIETIVVMLDFAAIVVLAVFAYWFQSRNLVLVALFAAMAGATALPLIERTYLRSWPRYRLVEASPGSRP